MNRFKRNSECYVEAIQFTGVNWEEVKAFAGDYVDNYVEKPTGCHTCYIKIADNWKKQVVVSDWIVKASQGGVWVHVNREFVELYSPVETDLDRFSGFDPDDNELLVADGYDDCIVGVVERCGQKPIVCYDVNKMLKQLVAEGMEEEDALEHLEYNVINAWVGDSTPCFLHPNK